MGVELVPGADPDVQEAVRLALARVPRAGRRHAPVTDRGAGGGADWRRSALTESVDRDPGYVPSLRRSRGASRT